MVAGRGVFAGRAACLLRYLRPRPDRPSALADDVGDARAARPRPARAPARRGGEPPAGATGLRPNTATDPAARPLDGQADRRLLNRQRCAREAERHRRRPHPGGAGVRHGSRRRPAGDASAGRLGTGDAIVDAARATVSEHQTRGLIRRPSTPGEPTAVMPPWETTQQGIRGGSYVAQSGQPRTQASATTAPRALQHSLSGCLECSWRARGASSGCALAAWTRLALLISALGAGREGWMHSRARLAAPSDRTRCRRARRYRAGLR